MILSTLTTVEDMVIWIPDILLHTGTLNVVTFTANPRRYDYIWAARRAIKKKNN